MKRRMQFPLIFLAALFVSVQVYAQDELEVTLEALPADVSADTAINDIQLPKSAAPEGHSNAAFGLDTANKARRLREEMNHDFGSEVSGAARERAQERIPNIDIPPRP